MKRVNLYHSMQLNISCAFLQKKGDMNIYLIMFPDKVEKCYEAVPHKERGYSEREVPWS